MCQIQPGYIHIFLVFASFIPEETVHLCNHLRIYRKWLCKPCSKSSKFVVFYCKAMIEHLGKNYSLTFYTMKTEICIWFLQKNLPVNCSDYIFQSPN